MHLSDDIPVFFKIIYFRLIQYKSLHYLGISDFLSNFLFFIYLSFTNNCIFILNQNHVFFYLCFIVIFKTTGSIGLHLTKGGSILLFRWRISKFSSIPYLSVYNSFQIKIGNNKAKKHLLTNWTSEFNDIRFAFLYFQ